MRKGIELPNVTTIALKDVDSVNYSQYIPLSEYAKSLGVRNVTVRAWIYRHKIPAVKLGSVYYIDRTIPYPDRTNKKEQ